MRSSCPCAPRAAVLLFAGATTAACGSGNAASVLVNPPAYEPEGQARSSAVVSQAEPLIVEWPAAARTKLEALAKKGLVTVRYTGTDMEVLSQCRVSGAYTYTPATRQRDRVTIRNQDELYANLPLGAASLEGKLKSAGQLNVTMTIVGTYQAERAEVRRDELPNGCERATHVVTALTAGAFEFFAGAGAEGSAAATALGAGVGGRTDARREVLNQAGDEGACAGSTAEDTAPPYGCGALIRVEVERIRPAKPDVEPVDPGSSPPVEPKPPEPPAQPAPSASADPARPIEPKPLDPVTPEMGPSDTSCGSSVPCPAPGSEDGMVMGIVIGTLLLASLVGAIVAVAVKDPPRSREVAPAGLGTKPVVHPYAPVLRW